MPKLIPDPYQRCVEGRVVHSDAGVRVLFVRGIRSAVDANSHAAGGQGHAGIATDGQSGRIVLAGAHGLSRYGIRDDGSAVLATGSPAGQVLGGR